MTDWHDLHGDHFGGMRALVTGGAGFIGSHLTGVLLGLGCDVVVLDDLSGGSRGNLEFPPPASAGRHGSLTFAQGSILDTALVGQCTQGCRYVFHQAALGSVPRSVEEPVRYAQVNIQGTVNVLEAARAQGVQRLMFAASSSAYGDSPTLPKVETMPGLPCSPYAATKLAGEHLCRAYAVSYGIDAAVLRYFNIFGPRQNANSAYAAVIAAFATSLLNGKKPVIFGDGEQSRDFTYIDNAVHANLLAARAEKPLRGDPINVATGRRITVNQLAAEIAGLTGQPHLQPQHLPPRRGDVLHSHADLARARERLAYQPIVPFRDGLQETVQWYARPAGVGS
jgi:UDP-glucose 4-epimerase